MSVNALPDVLLLDSILFQPARPSNRKGGNNRPLENRKVIL